MGLHARVLIQQLKSAGAEAQRQTPALFETSMADIQRLLRHRLQILERADGFAGVATEVAVGELVDFYLSQHLVRDAREVLHRALASLGDVDGGGGGTGDTTGAGGDDGGDGGHGGRAAGRGAAAACRYSREAAVFVYGSALAGLLQELNEPAGSEALYARCLALPGLDPGDTVVLLTRMAGLLADQAGREDEAVDLARRAVGVERTAGGWPSVGAARTLTTLAALCKRRGLQAEAERALRECVTVTKATAGLDHKETAKALNTWGTALKKVGLVEDVR